MLWRNRSCERIFHFRFVLEMLHLLSFKFFFMFAYRFYGWLVSIIISWNSRVCLEPSFGQLSGLALFQYTNVVPYHSFAMLFVIPFFSFFFLWTSAFLISFVYVQTEVGAIRSRFVFMELLFAVKAYHEVMLESSFINTSKSWVRKNLVVLSNACTVNQLC